MDGENMKFKKIETALCLGILMAFLVGVARPTNQLNNKLIRLHILANSDSPSDQALKLELRDSILGYISEMTSQCSSMDEAASVLDSNMAQLQSYAQAQLVDLGSSYTVSVILDKEYFETRRYDSFALPAGIYETLKITIGEGQGHNWWCVVFPAICMAATSDELTAEAMRSGLTSEDIALITEDGNLFVLKFRIIEILSGLKRQFSSI